MATILRTLSYKYQWLYNGISKLAAIGVGGESRFRNLPLKGLEIKPETKILDLCCGAAQSTRILAQYSSNVTGLDISPVALERAASVVPNAKFIEASAQNIPLADNSFDLIHTSVALHEMNSSELDLIFQEVYRILKPEGIFTFIDFHQPTNWLFWPPLAIFLWLFETKTAWDLISVNLVSKCESVGFKLYKQNLYVGSTLQVVQLKKHSGKT